MSRQSKNARNLARAKQITAMHKNGEKGPSKTTPLHKKRHGYRTNPEAQKRLAEFLKSAGQPVKTGGKKILEGAGSAAD